MTLPIMRLPCKNCITLSICRASRFDKRYRGSSIIALVSNCSLIKDYVNAEFGETDVAYSLVKSATHVDEDISIHLENLVTFMESGEV